jgi:hypothetical protein
MIKRSVWLASLEKKKGWFKFADCARKFEPHSLFLPSEASHTRAFLVKIL